MDQSPQKPKKRQHVATDFSEEDLKRFHKNINKDGPTQSHMKTPCHVWLRPLKSGYGQMCVIGKVEKAHRLSWILFRGEIPDGLCVCHHCDNPSCVNIDHLFLGTFADNNSDRHKKGRTNLDAARAVIRAHPELLARGDRSGRRTHPEKIQKGEQVWNARITEDIVRKIRKEHSEGASNVFLKRKYNVSNVWHIVNRVQWKHVC